MNFPRKSRAIREMQGGHDFSKRCTSALFPEDLYERGDGKPYHSAGVVGE